MGVTVEAVSAVCQDLRRRPSDTLAGLAQAQVVALITEWACRWREPLSPWRAEAEALTEPFPFAMTRISLDALLESLTPRALWALIDAENVRDGVGYPLIGHVIAGNTPLLAWASLLRALLVRSASYVKLPSNAAALWAHLFHRSLADIAPELASAIHLAEWPGGTMELDAALCANADCVMAHGSNDTLNSLRALCLPGVEFLGYGHRVSFGLCSFQAMTLESARGFARDILLYDQGGCLSPQVVYVLGDYTHALAFAECLAQALPEVALAYPQSPRTPRAAHVVRAARMMARMETDVCIWEDAALRWTVIARPTSAFTVSPTHGVVSVQPLPGWEGLPRALESVHDHLQGCGLAAELAERRPIETDLEALGVSRICSPGDLQGPPLAWRQDGKDVLYSLIPDKHHHRL